ncbi:3'-5' exonuclease [Uliginosibacterium gangwonense]|uniref:3'-5' exonuclease n=1 Tax=Uliginosibacterium gangwonense TaxID=392736 RepID=UPI00035F4781|nr:3'-5' exonuclease [Uliginosibacterium gangwonense]
MILVIDLEATCSEDDTITSEMMEIIEIGAVWANPEGQIIERFQAYVRPTDHPQLTAFCTGLTGIDQATVDGAMTFDKVAPALTEFAQHYRSPEGFWGSWGAYDRKQIERECARHGLANPLEGLTHQNLKALFAKQQKIGKQVGMSKALALAGLTLEGQHHSGIDDACNIARLLPWVLGTAKTRPLGS